MLRIPYIVFLLLLITVFSCEFDENQDEGKVLVKEITENIDTSALWNSKSIYIIKKRDFKVNKVLIIQGGAVIKFDPESGTSMTVTDSGYISCQGTINKPVIFTSFYDANNGTLANKSSMPTPKPGNWDAIHVKSKVPSTFNYCTFLFGGGGETKSSLEVDSAYADISNCTFTKNKGGTIDNGMGVLNLSNALPETKIWNCQFYNNELPMSLQCQISFDTSSVFHNPENINETNIYNAILVNASKINRNVSWIENEVPYVIKGNILEVIESNYLLLGNNITLKFIENTHLILANGANSIRNQNGIGVVFTSINDDKHKGDTRNDKSSILPLQDEWSIKILSNAEAFEWKNIFYAKKE